MTRELKLSLILGFSLVLVVTVLISDYLSKARTTRLDGTSPVAPVAVLPPRPDELLSREQAEAADRQIADAGRTDPTVRTNYSDPSEFKPVVIHNGGRQPEPATSRPEDDGKASEPQAPAVPERTHTIDSGDTLYAIAGKYYRNGGLWEQLASYNNIKPTAMLKVGSTIRIPPVEVLTGKPAKHAPPPVPLNAMAPEVQDGARLALDNRREIRPLLGVETGEARPPEAAKPKAGTYTVKKGDTLSTIAARQLGSARRTDELLSLNRNLLESPEELQVGMVLKLPSK